MHKQEREGSKGRGQRKNHQSIEFELEVPLGGFSTLVNQVLRFLKDRADIEVRVTVKAHNASITEADKEKILEALEQAGIRIINRL